MKYYRILQGEFVGEFVSDNLNHLELYGPAEFQNFHPGECELHNLRLDECGDVISRSDLGHYILSFDHDSDSVSLTPKKI